VTYSTIIGQRYVQKLEIHFSETKLLPMKKYFLLFTLFLLSANFLFSQNFFSRTGHVYVQSSSDIMDIEADNYQVASTIDVDTREIKFVGLLKSFELEFGLADRILNNKRVNVSNNPKFEFKGKIKNIKQINFSESGTYDMEVRGTLFMWGYKRVTSAKGKIKINDDGSVRAESKFTIMIEEESVDKINELMKGYLPGVLNVDADKLGISRKVNIEVNMNYKLKA